jgi:hypothetical protein
MSQIPDGDQTPRAARTLKSLGVLGIVLLVGIVLGSAGLLSRYQVPHAGGSGTLAGTLELSPAPVDSTHPQTFVSPLTPIAASPSPSGSPALQPMTPAASPVQSEPSPSVAVVPPSPSGRVQHSGNASLSFSGAMTGTVTVTSAYCETGVPEGRQGWMGASGTLNGHPVQVTLMSGDDTASQPDEMWEGPQAGQQDYIAYHPAGVTNYNAATGATFDTDLPAGSGTAGTLHVTGSITCSS